MYSSAACACYQLMHLWMVGSGCLVHSSFLCRVLFFELDDVVVTTPRARTSAGCGVRCADACLLRSGPSTRATQGSQTP